MTSIQFIVLYFAYLAVPMGLATLALCGRRPAEEETLEPTKILACKERRPR
jgi:hypothetical protein